MMLDVLRESFFLFFYYTMVLCEAVHLSSSRTHHTILLLLKKKKKGNENDNLIKQIPVGVRKSKLTHTACFYFMFKQRFGFKPNELGSR